MTSEVTGSNSESASTATATGTPKLRFRDIAIHPFQPVLIAAELLQPLIKSAGRDDVLFSGLAAWIVAPNDRQLRIESMQSSARKLYYRQCEKIALNATSENASLNTWSAHQLNEFRKSVYLPLGGINVRSVNSKFQFPTGKMDPSDHELATRFAAARECFDYTQRLMDVWHYLAKNSIYNESHLTVESGTRIVAKLGVHVSSQNLPSSRTVERSWEQLQTSVAFSYSAQQIVIPKRGTVFEEIAERRLAFKSVKPYLSKWFSYAKYVHNTILLKLAPGKKIDRFPELGTLNVEPKSFNPPHFKKQQLCVIRSEL